MSILEPGWYDTEKDILPRIDTDKNKYIFEVPSCFGRDDDEDEDREFFENMGLKCTGYTYNNANDEAIVQNLKPMTIKEFCKFYEETMDNGLTINEFEDIKIIRAEKCD